MKIVVYPVDQGHPRDDGPGFTYHVEDDEGNKVAIAPSIYTRPEHACDIAQALFPNIPFDRQDLN